jgi:hypothetical protein
MLHWCVGSSRPTWPRVDRCALGAMLCGRSHCTPSVCRCDGISAHLAGTTTGQRLSVLRPFRLPDAAARHCTAPWASSGVREGSCNVVVWSFRLTAHPSVCAVLQKDCCRCCCCRRRRPKVWLKSRVQRCRTSAWSLSENGKEGICNTQLRPSLISFQASDATGLVPASGCTKQHPALDVDTTAVVWSSGSGSTAGTSTEHWTRFTVRTSKADVFTCVPESSSLQKGHAHCSLQ